MNRLAQMTLEMNTKTDVKNAITEAVVFIYAKITKIESKVDASDIRITKLEDLLQNGGGGDGGGGVVSAQLAAMQKEIKELKIKCGEKLGKEVTDRCKTAVFGGFNSFKDLEEAKTWIQQKLWDEWLPQPVEIYKKGNFKGMFFCKFDSEKDRDLIVANIKRLVLKIEDTKIWSNPDLPMDVRAPEIFLFDIKKNAGGMGVYS